MVDIRMPSVSDAVTHREEGTEEGAGGAVEVDDEHHTAVHEVRCSPGSGLGLGLGLGLGPGMGRTLTGG